MGIRTLKLVVQFAGLLAITSSTFVPLGRAQFIPEATQSGGPCVMDFDTLQGPRYRVTGRIINDATNEPIPGAKVVLSTTCEMPHAGGRPTPDKPVEVMTDAKGSFAFENVLATSVNISATKEGFVPAWTFRRQADDPINLFTINQDNPSIELRLAPLASVYGIVSDENGKPMSNAWLIVNCNRPWEGWPSLRPENAVKTTSDGSYRVANILPASCYITAQPWLSKYGSPERDQNGQAFGYVPQFYPPQSTGTVHSLFALTEGANLRVDFQFHREKLYRIAGLISGGGPGAPLYDLIDSFGSGAYLKNQPHRCCEFEAWAPSGNYQLQAHYESVGGNYFGSVPVTIDGSDTTGLAFPITNSPDIKASIEITQVIAQNHAPRCCAAMEFGCEFWFLQALRLQPNGYFTTEAQSTMSARPDPATHIRSESITLRPGSYRFVAFTMGNVYAKSIVSGDVDLTHDPLTISPGHTPDPIQIVLAQGAAIEGVSQTEGKPHRAFIYAVPDQPLDGQPFQPQLSNPDGHFQLTGLAPGTYFLYASDSEVSLDLHDRDVPTFFRKNGRTVKLEPGENGPPLILDISPPPTK